MDSHWTNVGGLTVTVAWDEVTRMGQRNPPDAYTPAIASDPDVLGVVGP